MKPETKLTREILVTLRKKGGWWCKIHGGPSQRGIPDILGCYNGKFFAFEVKTAKGKLTELQVHNLNRIHRAGGAAKVIRSVEEAINVVDKYGESKGED